MKVFLLLSFFLSTFYANSTVFSVSNTNDDGAGSLRQAIIDANTDAAEPHIVNILIAGTITLNSDLPAITRSITINGNPLGGTAVSGNYLYTIFNFSGVNTKLLNVFLNDLELKYAFASAAVAAECGSAIHAIYIGSMAINRCYIHHNSYVINSNSSYLTARGGAISVVGAYVCSTNSVFYMRQTTVAYNLLSGTNAGGYVEAFGAGLYTQTFNDTIENCTFYGNKVFASSGSSTGQANATGGGLAFYGCSISINHSSFVSDTAAAENTAGGSHTSGAGGVTTIKYPIHISNSLADLNIADNSPDIGSLNNGLGDIISEGNNVIGNKGGGVWSSQQISDSVNVPSGVQLLNNNGGVVPTCAIVSGSPAIDKVLTGILLTTDGRNYSRDNKPDAGAYELNGISLPLQLINFSAALCTKQVCLQWNTADEINTKNFAVQKSRDGITFNNMAIVNAVGNGNHLYTVADVQPLSGVNFYRLQMNDKDGKFTYSSVVKISFTVARVIVFPNPASNYFSLNNAGNIKKVMLVQNDGRIIKQWEYAAGNRYDISNILPGFYTVKIETTTVVVTEKLFITK